MPRQSYKKGDLNYLITLAQKDDNTALEEIIRRVQKDVYAVFSHLTDKKDDISDLTQEGLLKMAKSIKQLKNPDNFRAWLNKIITGTFYDYTRKNKNIYEEYDEDKVNKIKDSLGCEPGEKCLFAEIEKIIKSALMTLPANLRITIVLREFEGMSYKAISGLTNSSLGTVKSRISRAREKLQKELKEFI